MEKFIQCKMNISDNYYNFDCNKNHYSYYLNKNKYQIITNSGLFPIIYKISAEEFAIKNLENELNQKVIISK